MGVVPYALRRRKASRRRVLQRPAELSEDGPRFVAAPSMTLAEIAIALHAIINAI